MKLLNIKFLLLGILFSFIFFLNLLDDNLLLLFNFLFVIFSLFFFLRETFSGFIASDIEDLYSKYVYYYEINLEYLIKLKSIYLSQCKDFKILFLKLYFGIFYFYKLNFINLLLNSYFLNLKRIEAFLFTFLENEILIRKSGSLSSLYVNLDVLELKLSDINLSDKGK